MAWYRRTKLAWGTLLCSIQNSINLGSSQTPNLKRYCLHRFSQKGYNYKRWIAGLGLAGVVYPTNLETIPYTKRTHLVLVPRVLERKLLGEFLYRLTKKVEGWKVLPATHPTSTRVKSIADNVIEAAKRGLRDQNYGSEYLDCMDWQVFIIDDSDVQAQCLPAGKIIVFRGLVEFLESDDEIAFVIAHEVAHAVARHPVEIYAKCVGLLLLFHNILPPQNRTLTIGAPSLLAMLPVSRKLEREADYIGLLLMASSGYDPRIALTVERKFGASDIPDVFSTHPSHEKTLQYLEQAQDEAMILYRKSRSTP